LVGDWTIFKKLSNLGNAVRTLGVPNPKVDRDVVDQPRRDAERPLGITTRSVVTRLCR